MSASDRISERLTPAARTALETYLEDTRNEILNGADEISASLSDYREIGVSEVLQAIQDLRGRRDRDMIYAKELRTQKLRLYFTLLSATGAALLTIAVAAIALQQPRSYSSTTPWAPALVALGTGILTASVAAYALIINRRRYQSAAESAERLGRQAIGEFLVRWNDFRRTVDLVVADQFGESAANQGFTNELEMLLRHAVISPKELEEVVLLYQLRNNLTHGSPSSLENSQKQAEAGADFLRTLIKKIQH